MGLDNAIISNDHNNYELWWKFKQVEVTHLVLCRAKIIYFNSYCYQYKSLYTEN